AARLRGPGPLRAHPGPGRRPTVRPGRGRQGTRRGGVRAPAAADLRCVAARPDRTRRHHAAARRGRRTGTGVQRRRLMPTPRGWTVFAVGAALAGIGLVAGYRELAAVGAAGVLGVALAAAWVGRPPRLAV